VSAVHSRRTAGETVSRAGQRRAASRDAARAVLPLTVLAPVVLVVGFVVAQGAQLRAYDPIEQTVSTLAGRGATDRWIMTTVLLVTGTIYLVVASGLRPLGVIARLLLGLGGAMVLAAALAPQPAAGSSAVHMTSATIAWAAFASWPLAAAAGSGLRRGQWRPGRVDGLVLCAAVERRDVARRGRARAARRADRVADRDRRLPAGQPAPREARTGRRAGARG